MPVAHQRDEEGNTTGEKDDAATETKQVVVGKTLRDEEYGADDKQKPAGKVITLLRFTDSSYLLSCKCCVRRIIIT
ncbi:MAG: hypothetical protein ABIK32_07225 [Chloroflexota bacterium]|nr:hypothetical protein [Chloroflexota bacterium]